MILTPDNEAAEQAVSQARPSPSVLSRTLAVPLLWKLVLSNVALLSLLGVGVGILETDPSFTGRVGLFTALAVLAAGAVSFVMVRLALRPLELLESTADRVRSGDASARVPASILADPRLERLGTTVNEMLDALDAARGRRQELALRVLQSQERDRGRMAGDLYDRTAQTLAGVLIHLRMLDREALSPACLERLTFLREEVRGALEEVRAVARDLRPPELDELGVLSALEAHARGMSETLGLTIEFEGDLPETRLSEDARLVLFRVVEEALTNVARHARASLARVVFRTGAAGLEVEVVDDGVGFDKSVLPADEDPRLGLLTMVERAGYAHGRITVDSTPGRGTRVKVLLPFADDPDATGARGPEAVPAGLASGSPSVLPSDPSSRQGA